MNTIKNMILGVRSIIADLLGIGHDILVSIYRKIRKQ